MGRVRVDIYCATSNPDCVIVVPEGADPRSLELPEQIAVAFDHVVRRGADLIAGSGASAVGVLYALLDIIAIGFHVTRGGGGLLAQLAGTPLLSPSDN